MKNNIKKYIKYTAHILTIIFAIIGLIFTGIYVGMKFEIFNVRGSISERNQFFTNTQNSQKAEIPKQPCLDNQAKCDWDKTPEWITVKEGIKKDIPVISKVSEETGVSGRMIAAVVIPEQLRFFSSNREEFKKYFEPLKILGAMSQFSLGISGIKEDTAITIENYANDEKSDFYPGSNINELIKYDLQNPGNHDKELYSRLTDPKNHYYQYLYTALFIKEIEADWTKQGFDISKKPEAIVTLFNIGFKNSHPKIDPKSGGATIEVGGNTYTYGDLGSLFYNSSELNDVLKN